MFAETECCHAAVVSKGFEWRHDNLVNTYHTTYDKELPFIAASKLLLF